MSILPAQRINADLVTPCNPRSVAYGMTYGVGPAGYDLRIKQDILLWPKGCALASSMERITIPLNLKARISDKSTFARRFIGCLNTRVDPGFNGFLTLEIVNHSWRFVRLRAGMPIAELEFVTLTEPTDSPYRGKYQGQASAPQRALMEPAQVVRVHPMTGKQGQAESGLGR